MNQRILLRNPHEDWEDFIYILPKTRMWWGVSTHIRTIRSHQGSPEESVLHLQGNIDKKYWTFHTFICFGAVSRALLTENEPWPGRKKVLVERKVALFDRDYLFAMNKCLLVLWVATSHSGTHPSGRSFTSSLLHYKKCSTSILQLV